MASDLETADNPDKLRRVVVEPVTRIEGHGKVTLLLDDDNHVKQARLHITEFRGFEKFIQGRPYWELPVVVQRLCGICPVSHHLAASKAIDMLSGVSQVTPTADKIRRLAHYGQVMQSHALHFFYLSSPDLLFGHDDAIEHRNIVGVIEDEPEIARQGILLRKFGQEVIRLTMGKRIHGACAVPGGVNKSLSIEERDYLLGDMDEVLTAAQSSVELIKKLYYQAFDYHQSFAALKTNSVSLTRPNGALELYDGGLRAHDSTGNTIFDHVDYRNYGNYLQEEVKSWSYMKFPFISSLGKDNGWYQVGPLARINNCDLISTPLAEAQRQEFLKLGAGQPAHATLAYHWARLIELLHCVEVLNELLHDSDILGSDLVVKGEMQQEGIGVIEAPRGTLLHHYRINQEGLVEKAKLMVPTTNNNQAMNESIRQVAINYLGGRELTEPLLNQVEVAIRAYDPCLSCATHAIGKMPLEISLLDSNGKLIDRREK
ncbi:Ni/Fe hydrogenase subunit alpha [Solemya velum gill symbiont]|uniref:Bidirectional hydrogenase H2FUYH, subunit 2H n=1 Tax=Solemya velum gill symbiont TaxID=2340 RepID=A0A0B0H527_SOVGS|nr:Ni/Fe hydrogenase subunit alpha [Solemya velum gill symbiont]KHF25303.1 bidirectional hydrogenase H2FUYH, subunit 2H [Solemya velum gill symbiont]OOY52056.1 Ni/Fe hydrogenase subunit alpha [Solemya velum gill symbiont]OOY56158.1 Ni/Fe hydrogenase subunit alpha [Solemya velum gill symbiont]OOY57401.1 Ni/Fe hydrogenase subunit alpha [Solemya velum gill symbiont]OOY60282.1 Ni/Fe hydrogenase subunit alpha [Solemya velum gill symbiont]